MKRSLEVVTSSAHVDLASEGFDVALRAGPVEDAVLDMSLVAKSLADNLSTAVASPRYLQRCGTPTEAADLRDHNCIIGYKAGLAPNRLWPLRDGGSVAVAGTLITNQMGLRVAAAQSHLGIALVTTRLVADALGSGELVAVLPDVVGRRQRAVLVYPDRTYLEPKVRAFVDHMVSCVTQSRRGP